MKKVILVAAVSMLALASCKKDYSCECTDSSGTETFLYPETKKSTAEKACDVLNVAYTIDNGSCTLK